jgi:hypothetical protein
MIYFIGNLKRKVNAKKKKFLIKKFVFFLKFFQNELEVIFNKMNERILRLASNEIYCYFYGNLFNKLSSKSKFYLREFLY